MQHKTLGFCLSLDEAFEEYLTEGNYTLIKRMLIVYFYNNDVQLIDSKNVTNLAIYSILMESFINKIPEKELRHASFTWPEFDPNTNPFV
ncbi:hypothetical protein BEWA_010500 [Theileria equi strain WA]|uniref:Uncharacterized protein n=1 Tax=Theileria equi strain WA TaxID=1537102 RepID=L0B2B2_THEEQ|nr:hypothetical protein BEWA_010500 [Theileria equi strain WA]AFZ81633.1 hypothetical protein BEWA_010500 [Theileria equi strain WA]|eukprot:XP_004831299.1 hypothetical protein BEWA_010500 [Theileria equi strain WA]